MLKRNQAKPLGAEAVKQEQPSVAQEQLVLVPEKMDSLLEDGFKHLVDRQHRKSQSGEG